MHSPGDKIRFTDASSRMWYGRKSSVLHTAVGHNKTLKQPRCVIEACTKQPCSEGNSCQQWLYYVGTDGAHVPSSVAGDLIKAGSSSCCTLNTVTLPNASLTFPPITWKISLRCAIGLKIRAFVGWEAGAGGWLVTIGRTPEAGEGSVDTLEENNLELFFFRWPVVNPAKYGIFETSLDAPPVTRVLSDHSTDAWKIWGKIYRPEHHWNPPISRHPPVTDGNVIGA